MHFMNCQLVRCISLFMGGRMHFMNCQLVRCISLFIGGRMHFMNCQLVRCILSIYERENAFHELSTREMHLSIYGSEDAFHELSTREMHLSIYGREDAFHELSTREMHPLYLWEVECISWTVNSWDASSLFMEGRMHFMNCQLVRCILSIYGSEDAFHELSTREMHPLYLWKGGCISWTVNSWDASSLFMEGRMHFMNCQLVRCILLIYGR